MCTLQPCRCPIPMVLAGESQAVGRAATRIDHVVDVGRFAIAAFYRGDSRPSRDSGATAASRRAAMPRRRTGCERSEAPSPWLLLARRRRRGFHTPWRLFTVLELRQGFCFDALT